MKSNLLIKTIKTAVFAGVIAFLPLQAQAQVTSTAFGNLLKGFASNVVQPGQNGRNGADEVMTIGGGLAKEANQPTQAPDFGRLVNSKPKIAPTQEYRGFNGRTAEQAFFSCKYDSYRAAAPGAKNMKLMEKMRVRMYVLDSCMNKEGFFRKQGSLRIPSLSSLTAADFGF